MTRNILLLFCLLAGSILLPTGASANVDESIDGRGDPNAGGKLPNSGTKKWLPSNQGANGENPACIESRTHRNAEIADLQEHLAKMMRNPKITPDRKQELKGAFERNISKLQEKDPLCDRPTRKANGEAATGGAG